MDESLLNNPIWNSLITRHASLAIGADVGHGLARRYPADIGPLSALREVTPAAFEDLAAIVPKGEVAALFLESVPVIPTGWELVREATIVQMVCSAVPARVSIDADMLSMHPDDFPEMVVLATLTVPGPFRARTAELGEYLGIRVHGRLAAMAGERLSLVGFTEISAVCTHPDFRGRGYAKALVSEVARKIHGDGRVPFLTSFEGNTGAIHVYEQVGFVIRRAIHLVIVKPPSLP
jgi:predicted GNAT family acetyltransferase